MELLPGYPPSPHPLSKTIFSAAKISIVLHSSTSPAFHRRQRRLPHLCRSRLRRVASSCVSKYHGQLTEVPCQREISGGCVLALSSGVFGGGGHGQSRTE
ncbi:hypothetical protein CDEST_03181 [Colletotrichum destructivum]|uniref:Uncharacterized protein n=1 Tax=Colletotrichum destructivum TaxID=34406 RepID=A0AAX4I4T3_9PEZI|nr:hypothetical protein CDEST_03181 [Colletotrichum destructivum]